MKICIYGASSKTIDNKFIIEGEKLGKLIAKRNHSLVFGGGANGLMGAVSRGAKEGGAKEILGIAPRIFEVDGLLSNNCTDFIFSKDMSERKSLFLQKSDAFIITAGGVGTFDEFFELLTLKQLGYHNKAIAILNTDHVFDSLFNLLETTIKGNFMKADSRILYKECFTPEQALDYIENYKPESFEVTHFKEIGKNTNKIL